MKFVFLQILLLSFASAFSQVNCNQYSKDYVPKNLEDALDYLDCVWVDKDTFKNKSERDAVADAHFAGGQWIRNGWGLWEAKNSLYKQFKSLGIAFPEDISSIILTSFHRRLNRKDVDLSGLVREYSGQKKKNELKIRDRNAIAKKLQLGDTVNVIFGRHRSSNSAYELALINYESELLARTTNCFIQGQIQEKKKGKGSTILTVKIIKAANSDSTYLNSTPIRKGESFSYNMTYFNLEPSVAIRKIANP